MSTFATSITLPERVLFRNVAGEAVYCEVSQLPANVIADLVVGGIKIISTNTWNGSGKDTPEAERMAAVHKRWDSWKRGEYALTERSASQSTLMKECYVEEMLAKHASATAAEIGKKMAATVKETLGKDTNATFDNFLEAVATNLAKGKDEKRTKDELKAALVAKYEAKAAELEASRAAAAKVDIDLTDIDI